MHQAKHSKYLWTFKNAAGTGQTVYLFTTATQMKFDHTTSGKGIAVCVHTDLWRGGARGKINILHTEHYFKCGNSTFQYTYDTHSSNPDQNKIMQQNQHKQPYISTNDNQLHSQESKPLILYKLMQALVTNKYSQCAICIMQVKSQQNHKGILIS